MSMHLTLSLNNMKKLIAIFLILTAAVVLGGCTKTTEDETANQDITVEDTKTTKTIDKETKSSDVELDLTEEDIKQLKSDIQSIQVEDLNALSQ